MVILSAVSLSFIAWSHLVLIACLSRFFSWITCSHLNTHTRWAASDIRICRSRRVARSWGVECALCSSRFRFLAGRVKAPVARMVPSVMFGQSSSVCSQDWWASVHTFLLARALQSVSMCSMLFSALHIAQSCQCWYPGMCLHMAPIMYA